MSTDITLGWTKEGTAGYVLDDNDVFAIGLGTLTGDASTVEDFYGKIISSKVVAKSNTNLVFGKNTMEINTSFLNLTLNSTATISFWLIGNWSATVFTLGFTGGYIDMAGGGYIRSSQTGVQIPVTFTPRTPYFVRIILNANNTMLVYVNGVLIGSTTFSLRTLNSISCQTSNGFIRDLVISKVARSGSFVPANILGY